MDQHTKEIYYSTDLPQEIASIVKSYAYRTGLSDKQLQRNKRRALKQLEVSLFSYQPWDWDADYYFWLREYRAEKKFQKEQKQIEKQKENLQKQHENWQDKFLYFCVLQAHVLHCEHHIPH